MTPATLNPQRLYYPAATSKPGRHVAVSPANSDFESLHDARIRLEQSQPTGRFHTEARETRIIGLEASRNRS